LYFSIFELYFFLSASAVFSKGAFSLLDSFFHIAPNFFPTPATPRPWFFSSTDARVLLAHKKKADSARLGAFTSTGFFEDLPNPCSISMTSSMSNSILAIMLYFFKQVK